MRRQRYRKRLVTFYIVSRSFQTATKVFGWIFLVLKLLTFFANLGYFPVSYVFQISNILGFLGVFERRTRQLACYCCIFRSLFRLDCNCLRVVVALRYSQKASFLLLGVFDLLSRLSLNISLPFIFSLFSSFCSAFLSFCTPL